MDHFRVPELKWEGTFVFWLLAVNDVSSHSGAQVAFEDNWPQGFPMVILSQKGKIALRKSTPSRSHNYIEQYYFKKQRSKAKKFPRKEK